MTFISREDAIKQLMTDLKMDRKYAEKFLDYHVDQGNIRTEGRDRLRGIMDIDSDTAH